MIKPTDEEFARDLFKKKIEEMIQERADAKIKKFQAEYETYIKKIIPAVDKLCEICSGLGEEITKLTKTTARIEAIFKRELKKQRKTKKKSEQKTSEYTR